MRVARLLVAILLASSSLGASTLFAGANTGAQPPIVVRGQRVVELRNTTGTLELVTQIPSASAFAKHGGGSGSRCSFTADRDGTTSDGRSYTSGQVVESTRWVFVEGGWGLWPGTEPSATPRGPLTDAVRWFGIFCDVNAPHTFVAFRSYPYNDPLFDPSSRMNNLYDRLDLVHPTVYRNAVVDRWGGLVVRYPVWLGIGPDAWVEQESKPRLDWRGWAMSLVATPARLDVQVDFAPDPEKPSTAFHGVVPCIGPDEQPASDGSVLPALPQLPEQTEPGVNGACTWTAPGPGSVTIRPRITYTVTFWASGYFAPRPDYVLLGDPTTFPVGEISSVNLDPNG